MFSYSLPASEVYVLTEGDLFHLRGALARDRAPRTRPRVTRRGVRTTGRPCGA